MATYFCYDFQVMRICHLNCPKKILNFGCLQYQKTTLGLFYELIEDAFPKFSNNIEPLVKLENQMYCKKRLWLHTFAMIFRS